MLFRRTYKETEPEEPMFTVATGGTDPDDPAVLLFYKEQWEDGDLLSLAKEPLIPEVVGAPFLLFPTEEGHIIAGSYETTEFMSLLGRFDTSSTYLECDENGNQQLVRPMDVYNSCGSPLKYAIGCNECLLNKEQMQPQCRYITYNGVQARKGLTAEDAYKKWKSRKVRIGDFLYVGPGLTSADHIDAAIRPTDEHDFRYVEGNTEIKKSGRREHKRHRLFKEDACSKCFVKKECWAEAGEGYGREGIIRYCHGNYEGTEYQTAREIVQNVKIPFTNKQLLFLLKNSGELYKRYNRCKYFATFRIDPLYGNHREKTLSFCLVRMSEPLSEHLSVRLDSFDEAKNILEKYGEVREPRTTKLPLHTKAALVELASRTGSPTYRSGWRSTSYPALGITFNDYSNELVLCYRSRSWDIPWTTTVKDLHGIHANYGSFFYAGKRASDFRRFRY